MVALGTDFPVEGINPLATFYAAVVRKDPKGYPAGGFQPENALTREEALNGMTLWAAVSNFEEEQKGTIEVGKVADFVVLDRDLLVVSDEEILQTKVMQTWIGGEMLYQNRE
jgi:predicted amidohydrolase YtcJ